MLVTQLFHTFFDFLDFIWSTLSSFPIYMSFIRIDLLIWEPNSIICSSGAKTKILIICSYLKDMQSFSLLNTYLVLFSIIIPMNFHHKFQQKSGFLNQGEVHCLQLESIKVLLWWTRYIFVAISYTSLKWNFAPNNIFKW